MKTVLGALAALGSGGAGTLFGAASSVLVPGHGLTRILARGGDEIWRVEELGTFHGKPTYLVAYLLQDPFRTQGKGDRVWLLHESRYEFKD
jgi:hypothetical protein